MKGLLSVCVLVAAAAPGTLEAQTAADSAAIVATALDYIDGYYTGDAARMERAVHPELAKRIVVAEPGSPASLRNMTASELIAVTKRGGGGSVPEAKRRNEVTILDIYRNAASVKIVAGEWIDYLHVGKIDGEWRIINVLWELKPRD